VLVLVLACVNTVEEIILDRARQKKDLDAKVIQAGMFNEKASNAQRQQVGRGWALVLVQHAIMYWS
jgi:SNF2 family DNA or RNA helicase